MSNSWHLPKRVHSLSKNSYFQKEHKENPFHLCLFQAEIQLLKSNFKLDLLQGYYQTQLKSLLGWRKIKVSDWQLER